MRMVEIFERLLAEVRRVMAKRKTTLRALAEEGLRRVVREKHGSSPPPMPDAVFPDDPGFANGVNVANLPEIIRAEIHHQTVRQ